MEKGRKDTEAAETGLLCSCSSALINAGKSCPVIESLVAAAQQGCHSYLRRLERNRLARGKQGHRESEDKEESFPPLFPHSSAGHIG